MLVNQESGRVYVGQSVNMRKRWNEHKAAARRGTKNKLYDAMRKHGVESFVFVVLEECGYEQFDAREAHWMEVHKAREHGYNIMPAGQLGRVMDTAAREAISAKLRGRKLPLEQIEKIRAAQSGCTHSEEVKQKIAGAIRGRRPSDESRARMSASQKERYASMTDAQKEVHRAKRSGWSHADHVRDAVSARFKGKKKSAEQRENMRAARLAVSAESEARRLAALRAAFARKRQAATGEHGGQA